MTPQFAIFDHVEDIPGTPTSQLFQDRIELIKTADQAGLAGYHFAEHHGGELSLAPSQELLIAAASQVTEQIRMGPLVKLLPMHHPMRLIEDLCILDQLTGGRVEYGVGRGAVPIEHAWFSDGWHASREKFTDVLGIIHRALATGEVSSEGSKFFDFPPMPMATRPHQERIPFWYPGSALTAGRHGMSLMWPGKIDQEAYEQYLTAWEEHKDDEVRMDGPDDEPRVGYSMVMAIAPTDAEAREIAQRGMDGVVRRTRDAHRFDHLILPEDECYAAQGALRAIHANMDMAVEFGHGSPERVADNLSRLLADGMADYVCLMFPAGDMTLAESRRTLDLFAGEVLPQLQAVGSST